MAEINGVEWEDIKDFAEKEWLNFNVEIFGEAGRKFEEGFKKRHHLAAFNNKKEIVGYLSFSVIGGVGELKDLMVKREARSSGIGSKLLEKFESVCKEKNCHKLRLFTFSQAPAVEFYKKRGYFVEAVLKNDRMKREWFTMSKLL